MAIYIPLGVFFIWMAAMTVLTLQAINREQERQEAAGASAFTASGGAKDVAKLPLVVPAGGR